MKWDFRHHLLLQIELLRGDVSHEQLSARLGEITERALAQFLSGKHHLLEKEFLDIAKALELRPQMLARAWAASLGLNVTSADPVQQMIQRAYRKWRQHSRIHGVPSSPSPMAIIRVKYADRLPKKTPPLWFGAHASYRPKTGTPEDRAQFARAYEMLVESVHGGRSHRDIGAQRGISGERARQLMVYAAYTWARSEEIDLSVRAVGFKKDAALIRNLYAALKFFAQQEFHALALRDAFDRTEAKRFGPK